MSYYDIILIGSSPISIVEAEFHRSQGSKVCVLEGKGRIGGAWGTVGYDNLPEIEIGSHIWSYNNEVYDFLGQLFNLDLVELKPQPVIVKRGVKIPYDWKANAISGFNLFKARLKLRKGEVVKLKRNPDYRFSLKPARYLYPKNGAKELFNQLQKFIAANKVEIKLNAKIEEVVVRDRDVEVKSLEDTFYAKQIILTSLTDLSCVYLGNSSRIDLQKRSVDYISLHIKVGGVSLNEKPKLSYVRVMDDALIHRVSDMTSQVQDELKRDERLFCFGIWEGEFDQLKVKSIAQRCFDFLVKRKYLSKNAVLKAYNYNVYPSLYSDSSKIEEVQSKSEGKIKVMRSTDFIYSFYNRLEDYKTLLSGNS